MKYRQSLMKYAEKYGVSRASRKYNKARSYIYFWRARWDGSVESLACESRRPHSHPNQHTEEELKLIRDMRRRNPTLGLPELWCRLCKRGYTRRPESLFRVMRRLGLLPTPKPKKVYIPKPYEQMTYPGQRVQVDVKVVPRSCIADPELRLFQYTAIDEYSRMRFLAAYEEQSTYSSSDFLEKTTAWFRRRGVTNASKQTTALSLPIAFPTPKRAFPPVLKRPPLAWASGTSSFVPIRLVITARSSAATARIKSGFTTPTVSSHSPTLLISSLFTTLAPFLDRCALFTGSLPLTLFFPTLSNLFDIPTR